jgi:hypothetical protein
LYQSEEFYFTGTGALRVVPVWKIRQRKTTLGEKKYPVWFFFAAFYPYGNDFKIYIREGL